MTDLDIGAALVAFVYARLAGTARAARRCAQTYPSPWDVSDRGSVATVRADKPDFRVVTEIEQWRGQPDGTWLGEFVEHIARHDPWSVLDAVEADLRMVELHADQHECVTPDGAAYPYVGCTTLRLYALRWKAHPDYDEQWRPA